MELGEARNFAGWAEFVRVCNIQIVKRIELVVVSGLCRVVKRFVKIDLYVLFLVDIVRV